MSVNFRAEAEQFAQKLCKKLTSCQNFKNSFPLRFKTPKMNRLVRQELLQAKI